MKVKKNPVLKIFVIIVCIFFSAWILSLIRNKQSQKYTHRTGTNHFESSISIIELEEMIWERHKTLDSYGRIQIKWNFTKEDFTMTVIAATTGYVGIGFSLGPNMVDSDIIIGWIENTKVHLYDFHATNNSQPVLDEQQDLELISGKENKTHSVFSFRRKLKTCDKHDIEITTTTVYALWSFHDEDPKDKNIPLIYHGRNRGAVPIHILDVMHDSPSLENMEYFYVGANKTKQIFKMKTFYYWCQFVKIPNFGEKHHLIGYVPKIQPDHLHLVHHILIYECAGDNLDIQLGNDEGGHMCWTPWNIYKEIDCRKEMVSWTIGSKGEFFPPHVGFPFGSSDDKPQYVMVQVHYSYDNYKAGLEDSSGLWLYHTNNLRSNDASTVNIAAKHFQIIPAKQQDFPTIGICSPTCTKSYFPPNGIRAFRYLFHGHKAVTKMRLHHFRNGKEINAIVDDNLNFTYQQARYFKEELVILPDDWLAIECLHDTMERSLTTMTGLDSEEEMCLIIMQYYPPVELDTCYSVLNPNDIDKITGNYHFSQNEIVNIATNPYLYVTYFFMMALYIRYRPLHEDQSNAIRRLYLEGNQIPLCLNSSLKFEYYTNEVMSFNQGKLLQVKDHCQ